MAGGDRRRARRRPFNGSTTARWTTQWIAALATAAVILLGSPSIAGAEVTGTTVPPTTVAPVVPIGNNLAPTPATVPFATASKNAHVDPILAKVSLGAFAFVLLLAIIQFVLTRTGRRRRWTL